MIPNRPIGKSRGREWRRDGQREDGESEHGDHLTNGDEEKT